MTIRFLKFRSLEKIERVVKKDLKANINRSLVRSSAGLKSFGAFAVMPDNSFHEVIANENGRAAHSHLNDESKFSKCASL